MSLPVFLRPLSFIFPVTYGVDILHGAVNGAHIMHYALSFSILGVFCLGLFLLSLRNIRRRWIT
jgi:ABC-2 type transport system permease protein